MEKCLRLFSQRAVTRVNDVEASAERFRVEKFDSRQLSRTEFLSDSKLRKECHAEAAVDHTLGGFDGVDFQRDVWHQAGAAEETVGQSPVARSAFVENQRPVRHLFEARAPRPSGSVLRMSDKEEGIVAEAEGLNLGMV